jgi:hypothetical protein
MLGRPVHGAEASSSRAALPASGGSVVSPERERVDAPLAHFAEAQDEHELWQELRDHDASLNRALNKALQIHSGPAWRVFRVRHCSLSLWFFPLVSFAPMLLLTSAHWFSSAGGRNWRIAPGRDMAPSTK